MATNQADHQIEIRELITRFDVESTMVRAKQDASAFDLDRAQTELSAAFGDVEVHRQRERLRVDDAAVIGDYLRSACPGDDENRARIQAVEEHVAGCIAQDGAFEIQAAAGVCIARQPAARPR